MTPALVVLRELLAHKVPLGQPERQGQLAHKVLRGRTVMLM
ncbi:hypothetical protein GCM10028807_21400 [Spirosoma daeguense]